MPWIDNTRFRRTFEEYSEIGATENDGLNRLALTDADRRVREQFVDDLDALGLDVRIDELGNIFGRRTGDDSGLSPVLIGSHFDSQPKGGRFDGQLGVLTALETLRTLDDHDIATERPIEIVNWTNEEGSRFQPAMMGSAAFTGVSDVGEIKQTRDRDGVTVAEALRDIGFDGEHPCEPHELHAALELHVEQGPQLEAENVDVGIVDGIYSMAWLEVEVTGTPDHAGPTPMQTRSDALATAVDAADEILASPQSLGRDAVATIGELAVAPDSINVIPSTARFTVDVRSPNEDVVDEAIARVRAEVAAATRRHGTEAEVNTIWQIPATEFSPTVREVLHRACQSVDTSHMTITSGAGHDAKHLNDLTDTGMIFVPSHDGRTHTEEEFTPWEACVNGAKTFFHATGSLAGANLGGNR